jgi:serine/threonine protein phosphatase PrpC
MILGVINMYSCDNYKNLHTDFSLDISFLPETPRLTYKARGISHRGKVRANNEDRFFISNSDKMPDKLLCVVADGMGGCDFGEEASSQAVSVFKKLFSELKKHPHNHTDWADWMQRAAHQANMAVIDFSREKKKVGIMGSTLVAALIIGNKAYIINIGDSRAYLFRGAKLTKITTDHSFVGLMVEKGVIQPDEIYTHPRRNEIMRFLGQNMEVRADVFEIDLEPDDRILLCSDGLWEMVRDDYTEKILAYHKPPIHVCLKLFEEAYDNGGEDNISLIVINASEK